MKELVVNGNICKGMYNIKKERGVIWKKNKKKEG